jgi:hypothetical protein
LVVCYCGLFTGCAEVIPFGTEKGKMLILYGGTAIDDL